MSRISLTIAVSDECLDNILEVAQNLRSVGMQVVQIMDTVGVITGSIEQSRVATVSTIEGVESVESTRSYQVPPPGSSIQ
jgi:isopropylmalate/homocitrate/citramalate synthase